MKRENMLMRWVCWMVVVTALFLLGFVIGKMKHGHTTRVSNKQLFHSNAEGCRLCTQL